MSSSRIFGADDPAYVASQYGTAMYYASSARLEPHLAALPDRLDAPLVARRTPVVLVAEKPA